MNRLSSWGPCPALDAAQPPAGARQLLGADARDRWGWRSPPSWWPASAAPTPSAPTRCCGCCPACWASSASRAARCDGLLPRPNRTASTPRLWPTMMTILAAGSVLGRVVWLAGDAAAARTFFPGDPTAVIAAAGATVVTQLVLTVGKTSLQGLGDRQRRRHGDRGRGAGVPALLRCRPGPRMHGTAALVVGLVLADVAVAVEAWRRVRRHWAGAGWAPPPRLVRAAATANWPARSLATACAGRSAA